MLRDVLDYRQRRRAQRYDARVCTSVALDDEDDPAVVAEQMKAARKAVAERRRSRRTTA